MFEWVAGCGYDTAVSFLTALRERKELAWRLVLGDWRDRLTRIYHRRPEVEDIASEAVKRFWGAVSAQAVNADQDLRGYFITIGVRCAIDLRRRRLPCGGTDPATLAWPCEHVKGDDERNRLIWEAVQTLSDDERLVVLRRVVSEAAHADIAQELCIQPGTCRVKYLRAIKKLHDRLNGWGVDLTVTEPLDVISDENTCPAPLPEGT